MPTQGCSASQPLRAQCCQAHWTDLPLRSSAVLQPLARMGALVTGIKSEYDNPQAADLRAESDVELAERLDYQAVTARAPGQHSVTGVPVIVLACCSSCWSAQ